MPIDPADKYGEHAAPVFEIVPDDVIEPKVISSTFGASAAGVFSAFCLWALDEVFWEGEGVGPDVPLPVSGLVLFLVPMAVTFLAGYYTRHVNREGTNAS